MELPNTKNKCPTVFNDNVSMIADRINITNKFNVFFTNIGEKMAKGINYDGNKNYGNYLSLGHSVSNHPK